MTLAQVLGRIRHAFAGPAPDERARRYHAAHQPDTPLTDEELDRLASNPEVQQAFRELDEMRKRQQPKSG